MDILILVGTVDEDFQVLGTAKNGREALELAQSQKADVILMDIQMPEMDCQIKRLQRLFLLLKVQ